MINIEYMTSAEETARATLDFMSNRPIMSIMMSVMKFTCILLCISFVYEIFTQSVRPQDMLTMGTAILWLLFYKPINRWIIKSSLKLRKVDQLKQIYKIDAKSIYSELPNYQSNVEWKEIKFVLKNKQGYIIPLTGFTNAGKFFWLPSKNLQECNSEQQLINILNRYKIKLRIVK